MAASDIVANQVVVPRAQDQFRPDWLKALLQRVRLRAVLVDFYDRTRSQNLLIQWLQYLGFDHDLRVLNFEETNIHQLATTCGLVAVQVLRTLLRLGNNFYDVGEEELKHCVSKDAMKEVNQYTRQNDFGIAFNDQRHDDDYGFIAGADMVRMLDCLINDEIRAGNMQQTLAQLRGTECDSCLLQTFKELTERIFNEEFGTYFWITNTELDYAGRGSHWMTLMVSIEEAP